MVTADIPGKGRLVLEHLVLDLNGTLTVDGALLEGVAERLHALAVDLRLHLLTADTLGTAGALAVDLPVTLQVVSQSAQAEAKRAYVAGLGRAAAVGNGLVDAAMLAEASLGVAVIGPEGAAGATLRAADLVVTDVRDALDLLLVPSRLVSGLRS